MKVKPIGDTINERIASCRKMAGYSQKDMAEALNMKLSTYSQRERNGEVTCDFVIKIAKYLDIDVRCLLFGDEKYLKIGFNYPDFEPEPKVDIPNVTIDGRTLYYLSGQQISVIKMISYFPKKYREKTIAYINAIYRFLRNEKIKRNKNN